MTDTSESIDLAELERLAKAATSGPWVAGDPHPFLPGAQVRLYGAGWEPIRIEGVRGRYVSPTPDAEFIAATDPDTVLALVARVRKAEARVHRVVKLRDLMQKERDDVDVSVRLSTMIRDLNAALTEGDEQ